MGAADPALPFWQVNVPPQERTAACPDFLANLSDKDRGIIGTPDAAYVPQSWDDVAGFVCANRLELFQRRPSDLRRYRAFIHDTRRRHGSIERFLLTERLRWRTPLVPRGGVPFENPGDVRVLRNDWPYGLDPRIVHLVVWTKFAIAEDPVTGDLTDDARRQIDNYVSRTFRSRMLPERVIWFKNWAALKSVDAVEHIHVMLLDPCEAFIDDITNGDVAACNIQPGLVVSPLSSQAVAAGGA